MLILCVNLFFCCFNFYKFLNMFQYMMILFIVFIVQFSISCACLALREDQQVGFLCISKPHT